MGRKTKTHKQLKKKIFVLKNWLVALLIVVLGGLVYSNSLQGEFQFDDNTAIVNNLNIKDLSNFTHPQVLRRLVDRPLPTFTFALNYHYHQFAVAGYHWVNMLLHLLTTWLVFLLLQSLLLLPEFSTVFRREHIKILALLGALFFLLHPIQTQSVAYITQRMTILAALFYLLTIYMYLKTRQLHISKGLTAQVFFYYFLLAVSGFLAVYSKQTAVTVAGAVFLTELFFIRNKNGKSYKILLTVMLLGMAFPVVYFSITRGLPRETFEISRAEYLFTQFKVIVNYFQLILLPIHQTIDHYVPLASRLTEWKALLSFVFLSAILVAAVYFYKRFKLASFAVFFFFLSIFIESSIFPIRDVMYEHRLYLGIFAISLIIIDLVYNLLPKKHQKNALIVASILLFVYAFASHKRNEVWQTELALWTDAVQKSPQKARPHNNLGYIYFTKGQHKKAIAEFEKAVQLKPDYASAYNNLANSWVEQKQANKAIPYYQKAIESDSLFAKAMTNLAHTYLTTGNLQGAIKYYKKALRVKPDMYPVIKKLARTYARARDYENAINYYQIFLKKQPQNVPALSNLGSVYLDANQPQEAIVYFEKALRIAPNDWKALVNLGNSYLHLGQVLKSQKAYHRAKSIDYQQVRKYLQDRIAATEKVYSNNKSLPNTLRLANYLLLQNQLQQAGIYYQLAYEKLPKSFEINYLIALNYYLQKNFVQAKIWLVLTLGVKPDYVLAQELQALVNEQK